jgi:hypothetical protein
MRGQSDFGLAIPAQLSAQVDGVEEGRRLEPLVLLVEGTLVGKEVVGIHVADGDGR